MPTAPAHIFEFGAFRLDTTERSLRKLDGTLVPLTPRVFKTLAYIVEHRGTVLDKERIMEAVWPDTIVEENNLAQAISKLRQVFGETPGADGYIVTVPSRGYRFVADVREVFEQEIVSPESGNLSPVGSGSSETETTIAQPVASFVAGDTAISVPAAPSRRGLLAAAIVAVAVAGIAALLFVRYRSSPTDLAAPGAAGTATTALSETPEKSIAVLPFKNLSRDPDNAYFAEGMQDEILTRLSKIADLKVISRTSTQHYQSAPENLPEIAKQLGVAHVLEGSVQKSGDAVRVNVQLIKAASDSHIWADTFDRKLTDIFSVESEVAKAIAEQLQAKITGREEQAIAAKPTNNPDAYDAYLRGLAYSLKTANTAANSLTAQKYLREAVRLDPKFALAWALLSSVDSVGYLTTTLPRTAALCEEAQHAAETAVSLQPKLGEALLANGYYHYGCLKDYDTAIHYFEQARLLLPNDSRIPESLAYVTRRRGEWQKSEAYFNEAERLDARNANLLTQHALSLMRLRRLPEALRKLDQVLAITPNDVRILVFKAGIAQAEGNLPQAATLLAPLHPSAEDTQSLEAQVYQAILERNPASIIPRLQEVLRQSEPGTGYLNGDLRFWLGWAQQIAGDHAAAQESWQQARRELESALKEEPQNFNLLSDLALISMGLGDKGAALDFAERALAANPVEKDAVSGPSSIDTLARVTAQTGEHDRAIAALEKLLSLPALTDTAAPITRALLQIDPMFDPLRNDPRFQKLVSSDGSKVLKR